MRVGRSVTLSGMQFGFAQITSDRRIHPASCKANATRQGMPRRFLSGMRVCLRSRGNPPAALV